MFVTLVEFYLDPEGRELFPSWVEKLRSLVRGYPGFVDARRMAPTDGPDRTMFMLLFDTQENTQRWADSEDRQELLKLITPHWTKPFLPLQYFAA